jgi:hypothetical protein
MIGAHGAESVRLLAFDCGYDYDNDYDNDNDNEKGSEGRPSGTRIRRELRELCPSLVP